MSNLIKFHLVGLSPLFFLIVIVFIGNVVKIHRRFVKAGLVDWLGRLRPGVTQEIIDREFAR